MNTIMLSGHLGNDPKTSMAGEHIKSTFSLGVRDGKDKAGNSKTLWFFCEAWDNSAEFVREYFKKGMRVEVVGKAVSGSYEQNGVRQNTFKIVCRSVEFGEPKREENTDVAETEHEERGMSTEDGFMNIPDGLEEEPVFSDTVFCPNCMQEVEVGEVCPMCGSTLPR